MKDFESTMRHTAGRGFSTACKRPRLSQMRAKCF
jgi:hypothetical protein